MSEKVIGRCPKCGADVVLRNGKYGCFIGCHDYPHCKWTTSVEAWDDCDCDPKKWKENEFWKNNDMTNEILNG